MLAENGHSHPFVVSLARNAWSVLHNGETDVTELLQ